MAVAELVKEYSLDEAIQKIRKNGKVRSKYDNFIGGKWVAPVKGRYFTDHSPIDGRAHLPKSPAPTAEDVELALDAAHAAKDAWGRTAPTERAAAAATRSPTGSRRTSNSSPLPRPSTTASRSARPARRRAAGRSIISAISPAASAPKKARWPRSTTTPSPTTSRSRWASSARSSPGTSRC